MFSIEPMMFLEPEKSDLRDDIPTVHMIVFYNPVDPQIGFVERGRRLSRFL